MANPEHLQILEQGIEEWNQWRSKNRGIKPDLTEASLFMADLREADLTSATLTRADLRGANLTRATLSEADLHEADLTTATLTSATLTSATLITADLISATLITADLRGADLTSATLTRADLTSATLTSATLTRADLTRADLRGADLTSATLTSATLTRATLSWATLTRADLTRADLRGADLTSTTLTSATLTSATLASTTLHEANLASTNLRGADLREADLTRVHLTEADLRGANLTRANLSYARLFETIFSDTTLAAARGLDTCRHLGPSPLDHRTLAKSGPLPLAFLRGCGLPDALIDYLPSLLNEPLQFYSCFISYASRDRAVAERLYADLQNKGVRCWFAPEDMKIGDRLRPSIDETIRVYDKLLLILSKTSVASQWVEQEVETALARERQQGTTILFPVRIDNTVMAIETGWPALIRNTRNIGDFQGWETHGVYQKAFDRLLRDLKIAERQLQG